MGALAIEEINVYLKIDSSYECPTSCLKCTEIEIYKLFLIDRSIGPGALNILVMMKLYSMAVIRICD